MNKCYGCDLCDDACPGRLFNGGDKLNIIYNSWNNEDDGVPLYSCSDVHGVHQRFSPQLVNYDSYVDIRRSPHRRWSPGRDSPHGVAERCSNAEAEQKLLTSIFIATEDYPIASNIGYYPRLR